MKSIMQEKGSTCYLCEMEGKCYTHAYLEEHHIFPGKPNRKKSEKYGLKVYLCLRHHRGNKEGVHFNRENFTKIAVAGQKKFEEIYSRDKFIEEFGRSYILDDE